LIFDLEIVFLFPWALVLSKVGISGFLFMAVFVIILTFGFFYEWSQGAIECE
jgi:NADH-quinone oxidoreductase subunit A